MAVAGGKYYANPAIAKGAVSQKAEPMPRDPSGQTAAGGEEHKSPMAHSVVIHKAANKFHTVAMHPQGVTTKEHGSMHEAFGHAQQAMSGNEERGGEQDPMAPVGGENEWMGGGR